MVRIGIVGAGTMGAVHAAILRNSVAGATLVAVSDPDIDRAAAVAAGGTVRVVADAKELIASAEVDAVVVASPDDQHHEQVLVCLNAGKPVLCEKPLAPSPEACRALVERERSLGRRLVQVGFMRRFDPAYLDIKAIYESGAVGGALILRCSHRNATAPDFFKAGMAITNAMVHEFDICCWLLGAEIEGVRVDRPRREGTPADDPLLATLKMSSGQLVSIEVFMNATYGYDIQTEIIGETGVLVMGAPATTRNLSRSEPGIRVAADFRIRFEHAYERQLQAWTDAIGSNDPCGASAADGLSAALAAEAAARALQSGEWERVKLA